MKGSALHPVLAALPGHVVWRAQARVTQTLAEVLPPGVDVHAFAVLEALADGVPRSQQSLADTVSTSRTTLARIAAELVAAGLVERVRDPADRRSYALTRTAAGDAAVRAWRRHVRALDVALTAPLTASERTELRGLVARVVADEVSDDAPPELLGNLGFLLTRLHFRLHRDVQAALAPLRIEPRMLGSLHLLAAVGAVAQADLARQLGVSGPAVVQIVDALEARRLVERRRDPADRRAQQLHLLPGAAETTAQAQGLAAEALDRRLAGLSAVERRRMLALLRTFVTGERG